jgi:hypothetical protein
MFNNITLEKHHVIGLVAAAVIIALFGLFVDPGVAFLMAAGIIPFVILTVLTRDEYVRGLKALLKRYFA